jgi:hypothetical protein
MSRTHCNEGFKRSKKSRMSAGEDPRPGQTSTSTNDYHVGRVHAVICGNCRLTVRDVADDVGISTGSCHKKVLLKNFRCLVSVQNSCLGC